MDRQRTPNPLLQPADAVLNSVVYLESDPNFKILISWIGACYAVAVNRAPSIKDEVELRWTQGQCQALLLVNKAFTQAHDELLTRRNEADKNALPRNP